MVPVEFVEIVMYQLYFSGIIYLKATRVTETIWIKIIIIAFEHSSSSHSLYLWNLTVSVNYNVWIDWFISSLCNYVTASLFKKN